MAFNFRTFKSTAPSAIATYAFTINYILGVGCLEIPAAMAHGGIGLSIIFILSVSVIAAVTAMWQVESSGRASELTRAVEVRKHRRDESESVFGDESLTLLSSPAMSPVSPVLGDTDLGTSARIPFSIETCYEGNELMKIFYGVIGQRFYEVCLMLYMFSALWTYAGIFASSMALAIPIPWVTTAGECDMYSEHESWKCKGAYWLFLAVFALVVIPLSCSEMKEQAIVQVSLTLFRFFAIAVMLVTLAAAIARHPFSEGSRDAFPYIDRRPPIFDWHGIGQVFSTSTFSQLFHHSTTPLLSMLKRKSDARRVFFGAILTTCTLYITLGIFATLYFGSDVADVLTLQWMNYTAESGRRVWYAVIISYLVIMFPPIDLLSAFPLNGVTFGNNLAQSLPMKLRGPGTFLGRHSKTLRLAARLCAVLPPLIAAAIVRKATLVVQFGGLAAFMLMFFSPALIQLRSRFRVKKLVAMQPHLAVDGSARKAVQTPYGSWYSYTVFPILVIVVGTGCFLFSLGLLLKDLIWPLFT
ncbi:Amino acid transporter transmembrane [Carpediemonas membranifera]|uniref:Amino acid transporter transmembrane n=1 Tax=Carpediemonas membranifera TaxID=201153 RepID=A0A8J6APQ1_9EUKA|nr:Amino acid transporter transmembrane [Carpediemonas membranifera]|eukprot:KAG9389743.1 Amino acid transporter transmembrane [Carpediemonas membranifera]